MLFQCPDCGFRGSVRMPAHLPKGKSVRIRCSRCQKAFPLSLGRLFPQEYPAGYQALVPDCLGCRGTRVGRLWVETVDSRESGIPIVVFPAHPCLPHDVMHDLMDPFTEYFRICYLEFPATRRNQQEADKHSYGAILVDHMDRLKKHLGVCRFHLLTHLGSAPLALDCAKRRPDSIASAILIEPDLRLSERAFRRSITGKLDIAASGQRLNQDPEAPLVSLLQDIWRSKLPQPHAQGLAKILRPGFQPGRLKHDLIQSQKTLRYATLSRGKTPTLILYSRDGAEAVRRCALYLQATLPAAEIGTIEKGGAWGAWFHHSAIANRLLSFKRRAEGKGRSYARKRSQTLSGQPLGWMVLTFAVLAAGLTLGADRFRFQPDFMSRVIPPLLAGLLPILWFVVPKKINPIAFLRFHRFSLRATLLPLVIGAVLGTFYRSLLLTMGKGSLFPDLPAFLISVAPGGGGRILELAGIAIAGLFVFGVAENLWVLRQSGLQVLLPTVLFTLLPPAFPDVLWKLPAGFAASVLFSAGPSIYCPLFLIAGFGAATELPLPLDQLPITWGGIQGVAVTITLLAAAVLLTVFLGTGGKPIPPEEFYFAGTINREGRLLHWDINIGIVMVVFSLIASAVLIFAFISV